MNDFYAELTANQRAAVIHVEGPLLILAGPGSGKTRVVTHRVAHMLRQGIPAWQIVALTFTNKAADEMRSRVEQLAPGEPVWMGTFHRFCARLLRRYAALVGLHENYSILDASDSKQAVKRAIETARISTSHTSPERIAAVISRAKNRLMSADEFGAQQLRHDEQLAARVYPVYQQQLLRANAVDFDDLLMYVATMLRDNPELRSELDSRYRYILVDEYQDTNLAQYAIVRALSIDHPNLAATGDPDQSIYGWRGADIKNILDFEHDYPDVTVVRLEENYRSTPEILTVADTLIQNNSRRKAKHLIPVRSPGEPVRLRVYPDGHAEADDIADQIAGAVSAGQRRLGDFAIFCRMNSLTRAVEHALRSRGLAYRITGGVEFYQRKEIKDLLAYLHLINNPSHDTALLRIINTPARGIGKVTLDRLRAYADRHRLPLLEAARQAGLIETISKRSAAAIARFVALFDQLSVKATANLEDLLQYLIDETGYQAHLEKTAIEQEDNSPLANVDEFVSAAVEFDAQHPDEGSLETFLEQVSLVSDTDDLDSAGDHVKLMTMHAAKGLEFPCVFVLAVEDDLLPHARCKSDPAQYEEERRLLFVGITRAQDQLQLSLAKWRIFRGDMRPVVPSPFLVELPRETMDVYELNDGSRLVDSVFDEQDQSYPESWDLLDEPVDASMDDDAVAQIDMNGPAEEPSRKESASRPMPGLATAAQLLDQAAATGRVAPGQFRVDMAVSHPEYGAGRIVELTGRGPKRTATVHFEDIGETKTFRLAFAKLTVL